MLTPDINNRIKVKEIFSHPWVVGFEKICILPQDRYQDIDKPIIPIKRQDDINNSVLNNELIKDSKTIIKPIVNKEEDMKHVYLVRKNTDFLKVENDQEVFDLKNNEVIMSSRNEDEFDIFVKLIPRKMNLLFQYNYRA